MKTHPKGTRARVLLSSVFGPYAQDDEFGSRVINPMELYHNQVTRVQREFSLRMFHRSWGIMMIQHNISAPCAVLDFPSRERFRRELLRHHYDVVGISGIIVNIKKVREMCRMVRQVSPDSTIVIGGHVTAIPGIEHLVDADHFVRGEGIAWMREFLGEDPNQPIRHPDISSGLRMRVMGLLVPEMVRSTAATIIPSVGCPMGCNFCTTSAFFGGKGRSVDFYSTGDQLFELMCGMEKRLKTSSFFVMDENFLLHKPRALRLLELMKQADKSWSLYVFSSINAIRKYSMRQLVELGVSWLWLGLESQTAGYSKLQGVDTRDFVTELHRHGIKLLGSTIIGMEHHTPANIESEIEYAVSHDTDFHQFMLYTPVPGTPLHAEMESQGRMLDGVDLADIHGQDRFNFRHQAISREQSKLFLDSAFLRDFERNGPSIYRICRTALQGWQEYKNDPDPRVRRRFEWEVQSLKGSYNVALWAMERRLRKTHRELSDKIYSLRRQVEDEFGMVTKLTRIGFGLILAWSAAREARRLERGQTYEPPTFLERTNWSLL